MSETAFAATASWSYGLAVLSYAAFALWIGFASRTPARARMLLLFALATTAAWAGCSLAMVVSPSPGVTFASSIAEVGRYAAWFLFVGHLLAGVGFGETKLRRWTAYAIVAAMILGSVLTWEGWNYEQFGFLRGHRSEYFLRLGLTIFGLMQVEQLLRRVKPQMRWGIKPLVIALAGLFGFDLLLYADSLLFGALDRDIWVARALANIFVIPLLAIATARSAGWTVDLHVSRGVVFQSSALLISGVFLLAIAGAGYFVRYFGGDWGRILQVELLFVAALAVVLVTSSGRFRSKLKVFVSKHFFSYRFDYREEWLRFTHTLSTASSDQTLATGTIAALANLVESPGGLLFLRDNDRGFVAAAAWNAHTSDDVIELEAPLPEFLQRTGWIVVVPEWRDDPGTYSAIELPDGIGSHATAWLIVPLLSGPELLGIVVLMEPRTPVPVDWEVRDLLKTASRQAASYLGQAQATNALLEARKFDAFNRMSAFVVHDLKNLVSQLSLMHRNAQRHHDKPAFQADMLATVAHVVERMNALMLQLRAGAAPYEHAGHVDIGAVLHSVCGAKSGQGVSIDLRPAPPTQVVAHGDRLEHVIGHLVQNAIEATPAGHRVEVGVDTQGDVALVEIVDHGHGMTAEFMRERLFKPFQTTKSSGMGIGVYESQQYLARIGGEIRFDSVVGQGTRVQVKLRRAESALQARMETTRERLA
jgi:putative PEP-CTERM system histidine kinase